MKYFLLKDNLDIPDRWFLGPFHLPRPFSIWEFTEVGPIIKDYSGLSSDIRGGIVTDFTFADFEVPIINDRVAHYLPSLEIQLIKIKAGIFDNLSVLILLSELDCLNENESIFTKFDKNSIRPDLVGHYQNLYKIVIDKNKCNGHSIFRIKGSASHIIANEEVKNRLVSINIRGILFDEV